MGQQFVKLIQIGSPENHIYSFEVVGGAPGFPGYSAEEFSGTTDGSGQATVVLSRAPAHLAGCFCLLGEDERTMMPVSIASGTHLLLQKRILKYDKPLDSGASKTGLATDPQGGAAIAGAAFNTADTTPTASVSHSETTGTPTPGVGGAAVLSVDTVSATVSAHHHSVGSVIDHKHLLTFTATSLKPAVSEAFRVLVLYT